MQQSSDKNILGVIGGLGPLASAEFMRTVYECNVREREQETPHVILYSDPSFPDRTEAFLSGRDEILLGQLTRVLEQLIGLGVSRVVICCMTMHYLLPRLPVELGSKVISLLDVAFEQLAQAKGKHLLICSSGTRRLELFEKHCSWKSCEDYIIFPHAEDQERIHRDLIYPIKKNLCDDESIAALKSLLHKYEVDSFIAGCSEVHLLAKHFMSDRNNRLHFNCIDPLHVIAKSLNEERI